MEAFLFGPSAWDSNPQGCGAEETRSVFQRSTRGPQARSGSGRRSRTRHPSSPTIDLLGLQRWRPFFLRPSQRDSNPTGCGAEETRSVFQRSTRGAERRSGSGRRQPHADIPHRPPQNWKRSSKGDRFCLGPSQRDSNPQGCTPFRACGQKRANMSTVTNFVAAFSIFRGVNPP